MVYNKILFVKAFEQKKNIELKLDFLRRDVFTLKIFYKLFEINYKRIAQCGLLF